MQKESPIKLMIMILSGLVSLYLRVVRSWDKSKNRVKADLISMYENDVIYSSLRRENVNYGN